MINKSFINSYWNFSGKISFPNSYHINYGELVSGSIADVKEKDENYLILSGGEYLVFDFEFWWENIEYFLSRQSPYLDTIYVYLRGRQEGGDFSDVKARYYSYLLSSWENCTTAFDDMPRSTEDDDFSFPINYNDIKDHLSVTNPLKFKLEIEFASADFNNFLYVDQMYLYNQ